MVSADRASHTSPLRGKDFLMKKMFALAALVVAVSTVRADEKTIVGIAAGNKDFSTLVDLVKKADLAETLSGKGPFTVFAPTNEAFGKLDKATLEKVGGDKELLKKVLLAHTVVGKAVMAGDVVKLNGEKVNGFTIKVADGKVSLSNSKCKVNVVKTDIKGSNGVIHVIDGVMIPE
jgi:uncharacterized surface protein with fasciclin (FAS1) repeats